MASAEPAARSGVYGTMSLAVAGTTVSGVFSEARGEGGSGGAPQFSCIFLLRGTLVGDHATVETWVPGRPERVSGELVLKTLW